MTTITIKHRDSTRSQVVIDTNSVFSGKNMAVSKNGYVTIRHEGQIEYLHRAIMGLTRGDRRQVDHVDRNKKNNQRSNLRIVTRTENLRFKGPARTNKLGLKGVCKTRNGRYQALMSERSAGVVTSHCLGTYATSKEAGLAYDRAALARFAGAYLNFPDHVTNNLIKD